MAQLFFDFIDSFLDVFLQGLADVLHFEVSVRALHSERDVVTLGKLNLLADLLVYFLVPDVVYDAAHLEVLV